MRRHGVLLVLLPFLVYSEYLATAAPLNYSETISGDLPNLNPLPIFAFGVGLNTISGRLGSDLSGTDFDSFAFVVPVGMRLIASRVEMNDVQGDITHAFWRLHSGSAAYITGPLLAAYDPPSPGIAELKAPLNPGLYNISNLGFGVFTTGSIASTANYVFTFTLAPEPSAFVLAATSLFAISLFADAARYKSPHSYGRQVSRHGARLARRRTIEVFPSAGGPPRKP
jgi:hypothetical protein